MKIQALAIIAIMLLLPMTLILSAYVKNQAKTLDYQVSYDTKLQNATYDALKAFQLNASNSDTSDIANSKLRDVKAGANTFFNALASAFNMPGFGKEELQNYVPAVVFTMYDGYYIYGPFQNVLTNDVAEKLEDPSVSLDKKQSFKYKAAEDLEDLKPYIYYSCRYIKGDLDVVITYALDNYIVIQGRYRDTTIDIDGYLLNRVEYNSPEINKGNVNTVSAKYRGIDIKCENDNSLKEKVYLTGEILEALTGSRDWPGDNTYNSKYFQDLRCRKINGVRYYATELGMNKTTESFPKQQNLVLTLLNGEWIATNYVSTTRQTEGLGLDSNQQSINDVKNNINALEYYKKAARLKAFLTGDASCYSALYGTEFTGDLKDAGIKIGELTVGDACTLDGKHIVAERDSHPDEYKNLEYFGTENEKIFEFTGKDDPENTSTNGENKKIDIEEPQSSFNEHRLNVIRYSIESNLSTAINNFNSYSNSSTYDFQMPRLKDTDWEKIYNNISIISFMQGLSIGGKIYSGYSVIPNNNNKEVVTEDSIVFVCDDKVYNTTSKYFVNGTTNPVLDNNISSRLTAVSKNTVSRASSENLETGEVRYFYRYPKDNGWYDYDSIVTSLNNNSDYSMQKSSTKTINYNNLYDYMEGFKDELTNKKLIATNYFTALGRERQGMYRVHNNGVFKTLYEGDNE